jgi:hypothetical protein
MRRIVAALVFAAACSSVDSPQLHDPTSDDRATIVRDSVRTLESSAWPASVPGLPSRAQAAAVGQTTTITTTTTTLTSGTATSIATSATNTATTPGRCDDCMTSGSTMDPDHLEENVEKRDQQHPRRQRRGAPSEGVPAKRRTVHRGEAVDVKPDDRTASGHQPTAYGVLGFPPKTRMVQGEPRLLEIFVAPADAARLIPRVTRSGDAVATTPVAVATVMRADLVGEPRDFTITRVAEINQTVDNITGKAAPAKWTWSVKALRPGQRRLELQIYVVPTSAGQIAPPNLVLVKNQNIDVQIDYTYVFGNAAAIYWPYGSPLLIALAGGVYKYRNVRRRQARNLGAIVKRDPASWMRRDDDVQH